MLPPDPAAIAHYNRINRYGQANGMVLTVPTPGHAEYRLQVHDEHRPSSGTAHSGVLAGRMDALSLAS